VGNLGAKELLCAQLKHHEADETEQGNYREVVSAMGTWSPHSKSDSAVSRYDSIPSRPEPKTLRDESDGEGRASLSLSRQRNVQEELFRRTLSKSHLYFQNKEQEARQTTLITEYITLTVNVAREDFPSISADIPIKYSLEAAQSAWRQFLVDVRVALNIEFIEVILDKMDSSPVHRVMRLRPGGQCYVKQREDSAVLEVIVQGKLPEQISWPTTQGITRAKDDLQGLARRHGSRPQVENGRKSLQPQIPRQAQGCRHRRSCTHLQPPGST
jgi:hypothetical protein